ncbi:hypothetical protein [Sphingomonas nostoxanthinifaciens]|uniref:hypothetical protein n=1 Tax=Sphingomonas nostoxanthinifaciens TaxID=2872652 RepID=UPI001CC213C2|nr:hypothetical protein [Sphingomonas nostoxanthinifaciens]UAK24827.1 hypothetical protein K8P63_00985 [Sphingomonas nostoxanthinifaciens]
MFERAGQLGWQDLKKAAPSRLNHLGSVLSDGVSNHAPEFCRIVTLCDEIQSSRGSIFHPPLSKITIKGWEDL